MLQRLLATFNHSRSTERSTRQERISHNGHDIRFHRGQGQDSGGAKDWPSLSQGSDFSGVAGLRRRGRTKTYYFVKRVSGKPKRLWLGAVDQLSVTNAEGRSQQAATIAGGADPQSERKAARHEPTFTQLWESYLELHAKPQKKSWKDDQRRYDKYLTDLHDKRLSTITQAVIAKWHGTIAKDHGRSQANRCKALISTMFNKASGAVGFTGANPCRGVAKFPSAGGGY